MVFVQQPGQRYKNRKVAKLVPAMQNSGIPYDPPWAMPLSWVVMDKQHYQYFLRLYNRRRYQFESDMIAANYTNAVYHSFEQMGLMFDWCEYHLPNGSYVYDWVSTIWFSNDSDAVQCKLTFM